jgi:hypothetical protein
MTLSISLIILFATLTLVFYLTRKFKWRKYSGAECDYVLGYKMYVANIESYFSENNMINVYVYKNGVNLYLETGCESIRYAKDIAEQVIIEDEFKNEQL